MFSLSTFGLENADASCPDHSFTFILGLKRYYCAPFMADFISPVISQIHIEDPFASEFEIDIDDDENHFLEIMELMKGRNIEVTQANCDFLLAIGTILGNTEIIEAAEKETTKSLTKETVVSRLNEKVKAKQPVDAEISFISLHLWEIPKYKISTIDLKQLRLILQSKDLKIESENWLFSLILELIEEKGPEYKTLLDFVSLEFLTETEVTKFLEIIDFEHLSSSVWESICQRLIKSLKVNTENTKRETGRKFDFSSSDPLNGVFDTLIKENGKDLYDKGIVKIESSSAAGLSKPSNVTDRSWTSGFYSENLENSWISFDFGESQLRLAHYTIKTIRAGRNNVHLRSWVIEGSDDGDVWTVIDEKDNSDALNGKDKVCSWKCPDKKPFRLIRLRQTDKNHASTNTLALANIELFGTLI